MRILTGICAGVHRPDGATIAGKMLFMVAAMAAEMERDGLTTVNLQAGAQRTPGTNADDSGN